MYNEMKKKKVILNCEVFNKLKVVVVFSGVHWKQKFLDYLNVLLSEEEN